jgi:quercetin dioxygenase-like cupin family protein
MNINNFLNGWIVGDFEPSLIKSKDIEIGVLDLKKGERGDGHFHLKHSEYNIILYGMAKIENKIYNQGDVFIYLPKEKSYVEYLEDTKLLVIKTPSTKNDKYYESKH